MAEVRRSTAGRPTAARRQAVAWFLPDPGSPEARGHDGRAGPDRRDRDWRPGGDHKHPRDKYKLPPGVARRRWKEKHLGAKRPGGAWGAPGLFAPRCFSFHRRRATPGGSLLVARVLVIAAGPPVPVAGRLGTRPRPSSCRASGDPGSEDPGRLPVGGPPSAGRPCCVRNSAIARSSRARCSRVFFERSLATPSRARVAALRAPAPESPRASRRRTISAARTDLRPELIERREDLRPLARAEGGRVLSRMMVQ